MNDTEVQLAEKFVEQTICCDSCQKKLLNYAITAPHEPVQHVLIAMCPFCEGESEAKVINGLMSLGPIGKDQSVNPTRLGETDLSDKGVWQIRVEKAWACQKVIS